MVENIWWLLLVLYMPNSGEEYDEDQYKVAYKIPFQDIRQIKIDDKYSVSLHLQYFINEDKFDDNNLI